MSREGTSQRLGVNIVQSDDELTERMTLMRERINRVPRRLVDMFGYGDNVELRKQYYSTLRDLALEHGEPVLDAITTAARAALGKRKPGPYFVRSCKLELERLGLWTPIDLEPF